MSHWCRDQARPQVKVGASLGERGLIASPTKVIAHPMNDSSISAHTERCSRRKAWDGSTQVSSDVLPSSVHHASSPKSLQARAELYLNWASFSHARIRPHLRLSQNPPRLIRWEARRVLRRGSVMRNPWRCNTHLKLQNARQTVDLCSSAGL